MIYLRTLLVSVCLFVGLNALADKIDSTVLLGSTGGDPEDQDTNGAES